MLAAREARDVQRPRTAAVGGLIFRCEMCPNAYCEDHLPPPGKFAIVNRCKRFQALDQVHPKQARIERSPNAPEH